MRLIVGTYSFSFAGMKGNGEGIHSVPFDTETGAFGAPDRLAKCVNPSALALSPDGALLFAGREVFAADGPGLASFRVASDGSLQPLSSVDLAGELPCHLAFDPVQRRLASAQYWTGDVAISAVAEGVLQPPVYLTRSGHGPNAARQEGPHAHCVAFTDDGTVLHLVDLGTDSIVSHRLDAAGRAVETAALTLADGSGPRHMALNHDATRAWVFCELDESLAALSRDGLGWALEWVHPAFPLPTGTVGSGAAIRLSPDEAHVYVSGRRQSQIAGFTADGERLGAFDCGGTTPREFIVTPDGRWVIAANQESDSLTSLRRDPQSGNLTLTGHTAAIGSPVALIAA